MADGEAKAMARLAPRDGRVDGPNTGASTCGDAFELLKRRMKMYREVLTLLQELARRQTVVQD